MQKTNVRKIGNIIKYSVLTANPIGVANINFGFLNSAMCLGT